MPQQLALLDPKFIEKKPCTDLALPTEPPCAGCTMPLPCKAENIDECEQMRGADDEGTILMLARDKPITLKGVFFFCHLPTEARLTAQVGPLTPDQLQRIWREIEDWRKPVDELYKQKTSRGRESKARGKRITAEQRERVFSFPVFPSSFLNILSALRRDLCDERIRNCIVLEEEQVGNLKQNLYVLPYANLPEMLGFIQGLNKRIDELNVHIMEFKQTGDYDDLINILKDYQYEDAVTRRSWTVPHITFRVTPIALEPTTVMQMIETERGKMASDVMETYRAELEKQQQELVTKAVQKLSDSLSQIVERIVATERLNPEKIRTDLERLRGKASSIGLENLTANVINPLIQVVESPEMMLELFNTMNKKDLPNEISGRVRGLLRKI